LSFVGRRLSAPDSSGGRYTGQRFDRQSLTALFHAFDAFERDLIVPGGREMIGIFRGRGDG